MKRHYLPGSRLFLLVSFLLLLPGLVNCSDSVSVQDPDATEPGMIVINEFMVIQEQTLADSDFGEFSGWIELHNRRRHDVELDGWALTVEAVGSPGSRPNESAGVERIPESGVMSERGMTCGVEETDIVTHRHVFSGGVVIGPDEYLLVWMDGQDMTGEGLHAGFQLPVQGGRILLEGPERVSGLLIDSLSYDRHDVAPDISMGRYLFGGNDHPGFLLPMTEPTPGEPNRLKALRQLDSFPLQIPDPSGLAPDHTGRYLWSVSDDPGRGIYKLNRTGEIVLILQVGGDDMEGIAQHPVDRTLWVAEERLREVVQFDTLGNELRRLSIPIERRRDNDGLEGITINPVNNHLFVVNEKNPRVLLEIDPEQVPGEQIIRYIPMNFGAPENAPGLDLSGLHYDPDRELLWMVSDEARAVFILDRLGRPLAVFDADVPDLEGIAIFPSEKKIWLVSDALRRLYVYDMPDPLRHLNPSH